MTSDTSSKGPKQKKFSITRKKLYLKKRGVWWSLDLKKKCSKAVDTALARKIYENMLHKNQWHTHTHCMHTVCFRLILYTHESGQPVKCGMHVKWAQAFLKKQSIENSSRIDARRKQLFSRTLLHYADAKMRSQSPRTDSGQKSVCYCSIELHTIPQAWVITVQVAKWIFPYIASNWAKWIAAYCSHWCNYLPEINFNTCLRIKGQWQGKW